MARPAKSLLRLVLLVVLPVLGACSPNPDAVSAENFHRVIQACLDRQPPVAASVSFGDRNLVCEPGPNSCTEQDRARLKMLVRAGLLAVASQSSVETIYRMTPKGAPYLHPRVMGVSFNSGAGTRKILGYSVDEGDTVVTKIDSYTKPGTNSEGATSATVWFVAEKRPYEWVKPYVAEEANATHLGQSAPGQARLMMTNKGWRVTSLTIQWPQTTVLP